MEPVYDALEVRRRTAFIHKLRWFWPVVKNADDVQRVTLLGYWVCMWLAALNVFVGGRALVAAQSAADRTDAASMLLGYGVFYVLAANALRRRSVAAAALVVALEALAVAGEYVQEGRLPVDTTLYLVLLLIVWRGIFLAAHWESAHAPSEPLTYNAFFGHALTDRWPQVLWPRFRIIFWILGALAVIYALLTLYFAFHAARP